MRTEMVRKVNYEHFRDIFQVDFPVQILIRGISIPCTAPTKASPSGACPLTIATPSAGAQQTLEPPVPTL